MENMSVVFECFLFLTYVVHHFSDGFRVASGFLRQDIPVTGNALDWRVVFENRL